MFERYVKRARKTHTPTIIGVFNHKGGVGKTTISINLAYTIAKKENVLLVEADQQCNIQQYFDTSKDLEDLQEEFADESSENFDIPRKQERSFRYSEPHIPNPRAKPKRTNEYVNSPDNLYDLLDAFSGEESEERIPICPELKQPNGSENHIFFMPGMADIMNVEQNFIHGNGDTGPGGRRKLTAFRRLIHKTMDYYDCRITIVDFGPHSGYLNQVLITSTDLIIPPCFADPMSFGSSKSLIDAVLPHMFRWYTGKISLYRRKGLKTTLPWVLPFVVSKYTRVKGKITSEQSGWIKALGALESSCDLVESRRIRSNNTSVMPLCPKEDMLLNRAYDLGVAMVDMHITKSFPTLEDLKKYYDEYARWLLDVIDSVLGK